ncbi:hypothetical protein M5K25_003021 [Dendrobium thyrsiflorum]|uniref:Uncharacterized protein n=1 Tax=Dendrobium thyrsiflorum TaxID=117978 RepID=A0ABD0VVA9_DENTH
MTVISGQQRSERSLSGDRGQKDRSRRDMEVKQTVVGRRRRCQKRSLVAGCKSDVNRWPGGSPASGGGPAEVWRQAVVKQKSGVSRGLAKRKSGVRQWSGGSSTSGGGPAQVRYQKVVRQKSSIKWWSSGSPTSGGGQEKLLRQAVVRQNSGMRRCSDGTPCGWSRRSKEARAIFDLSLSLLLLFLWLEALFMRKEGSIYRFSRVTWLINSNPKSTRERDCLSASSRVNSACPVPAEALTHPVLAEALTHLVPADGFDKPFASQFIASLAVLSPRLPRLVAGSASPAWSQAAYDR